MLPYLEITHIEPLSCRFCLIMQNILWNLFGIDVPNDMSDSVDEKKLTSETSCRRERVPMNPDSSDSYEPRLLGFL